MASVLLAGLVSEKVRQGIEATFLEGPVAGQPRIGVLQWLGAYLAYLPTAVALAFYQAGLFEHLQVFGYGRQRHVERCGQFADGCMSARQPGENGAPGRIGERRKRPVEIIFNHIVSLIWARPFGKWVAGCSAPFATPCAEQQRADDEQQDKRRHEGQFANAQNGAGIVALECDPA